MNYTDLVYVQMGTDSTPSFSHGNILPITGMPFGMTSFAIETRADQALFFHPNDHVTTGVRLTHLASPWLGDYCFFTMMPQTGEKADLRGTAKSGYRRREADMRPYRLSLTFQRYRASFSLAPTIRGAVGEIHYDEPDALHRLALRFGKEPATVSVDLQNNTVTGTVAAPQGRAAEGFQMYFRLAFDRPLCGEHMVAGDSTGTVFPTGLAFCGSDLVLNLAFAQDGRHDVGFELTTSFISGQQAEETARQETRGRSFAETASAAKAAWEKLLAKIEIVTPDIEQARTFYTCLYRMFLFPRTLFELDSAGKPVHCSPADGKLYNGPLYTDNGFWDTYRTVYPLFSILIPELYAQMCAGFLNYYREAGWLPRWLSPGALDCMPGTAIDAVFADAVVKGVVSDSEQIGQMLEAMRKHAEMPSEQPQFGREGIRDYLRYHYVPVEHWESVNKTQDYSYGDFAIAMVARRLGRTDLCQTYLERSLYYRNLFDRETQFLRAKDKDGRMRQDWTPFDWGADYTEGGPWQNSFSAFHDIVGLAEQMGGREAMAAKLDALFKTPPYFRCVGYETEIHEMTEMAAVDFGQCALSNQPSFHIPYLYAMLGKPDRTAYWVRKALRELFSYREDGLPGDEDNGSMAGWYVFGTMGFYPVCPATGEYVIGSPAVQRCVLHTGDGTEYVIEAAGNTPQRVYVDRVEQNGQPLERIFLRHEEIMRGGRLAFTMTAYPTGKEIPQEGLPYSVSTHESL